MASFFFGHETFANGAMRYEKEEDKRGKHRPRWDTRVIRSLGDEESVDPKERMVAESQEETAMCERSHNYVESEW